MKTQIKKYLNIYVVVGFIGFFSFAYMLSFAFILNDVANGSSVKMKKAFLEKQEKQKQHDEHGCMFICLKQVNLIKTFDNKINIVGDDLKKSIKKGSKVSIASSIFSIYGYESLK